MPSTSTCPGCGLELPTFEGAPNPPINASAECYQRSFDVAGYELTHQAALGAYHQMMVDAYGAQHPGEPGKPIRLVYSLVGLHLALDRGLSGIEVREAHSRMGKPSDAWPRFERPEGFAAVTVDDVARAGVDAGSPEGHARAMVAWGRAVWEWWALAHADVESLADGLLGEWLSTRG